MTIDKINRPSEFSFVDAYGGGVLGFADSGADVELIADRDHSITV